MKMLSRHRWPLALAKGFISAGIIYWILHEADLNTVFHSMADANKGMLVFAFMLFFVGYFITALRWQILLGAQGVKAPLLYLVQSFSVAVFFNNFLPSSIGGDVVRMYDSWRISKNKAGAVSVVMIDRFFGVFSLLLLVLGAITLTPEIASRIPALPVWIGGGLLVAAIFSYSVFINPAFLKKLAAMLGDKAGPVSKLLHKLLTAIEGLHGRTDIMGKALGLSFLLQANVIFFYTVIAHALGMPVPAMAMIVIIPVAIIVMMLPISINAIGVREAVFVFLFSLYGVPKEQSIAFAWIAFAFILLQGVIGGLVFAFRNPPEIK